MKFRQTIIPPIKPKRGRKPLSERTVLLTQRLYARGLTMREVAARVGIAIGSVHKIIHGDHPNQTRTLVEIKKEESRRLYNHLRRKHRRLFAQLPPFYEIDWMRIRGKKLLIDTILSQLVNGVMTHAPWLAAKTEAQTGVA